MTQEQSTRNYHTLELKKMWVHATEYRRAFQKVDRELWDEQVTKIEEELRRNNA